MHDGAIIHDEVTVIGEVAPIARREMYHLPNKTEEDDLAGISALMQAIPGTEGSPTKKTTHKKHKTNKRAKQRKARQRSHS
jgi:predicted 2-oxoglutarate/Fe(II)-dependent dioxygenase YbiX